MLKNKFASGFLENKILFFYVSRLKIKLKVAKRVLYQRWHLQKNYLAYIERLLFLSSFICERICFNIHNILLVVSNHSIDARPMIETCMY